MTAAEISSCGRYRYSLTRGAGVASGTLAWLMLNPSTADAMTDDPTIRKVVGFTARAGYGVALVVNLFAWRSTDPKVIARMLRSDASRDEVEGADNRDAIRRAAIASNAIVCAWGAAAWAQDHAAKLLRWLADEVSYPSPRLLCLGRNRNGSPLHPLMPSYDGHPLVEYQS